MQAKSLTVGWILMLILGVYRTVMGIVFAATGADAASIVVLLVTGAAIIAIALTGYKKAAIWSWWVLLVIGVAPLVSCCTLYGLHPITIVGWILCILALAIPAKAILCKKCA